MDFQYEQDDSIKQRSNPIRSPAAASENINNGGFDCNICLESALDPVVTLCGHLYCWPCIYKWLQVQNSTAVDSTDQPKCPVCKTSISHSSVVPLYGRGSSSSSSSSSSEARKRLFDAAIPQRPAAIATTSSALPINAASVGSYPHHPPPPPNPHHQLHPNIYNPQQPLSYFPPPLQPYFTHSFGGYAPMGQQGVGNTTMTSFYSPTIGMFGDMVCSGIFGSSGPNWFATNHSLYSSPRRVRRQEMQVEKSLWRFYTFLVCVAVLCLLLF